jgi:hypothetical protein
VPVTQAVLDGILEIRDSGRTFMCDWRAVQRIADELGLYDLFLFIEENPREYFRGISVGFEVVKEGTDRPP